MDFNNHNSINDLQIGLDLDLTGLTKYHTKTEVNNSLALKANQATTYSKTEVDNNLLLKQK